MPKSYRRSLAARVSDFLGGVAAAGEPSENGRNRRPSDLRTAWIKADRMIGICKF